MDKKYFYCFVFSLFILGFILGIFLGTAHAEPDENINNAYDTSPILSVEDDTILDSNNSVGDSSGVDLDVTAPSSSPLPDTPDTDTDIDVNTDVNIDDVSGESPISPTYSVDDVVERLDICISWLSMMTGYLFWTIVLFVCFWIAWICLKQFNRFT